jgi:hypothetical protein
VGVVLNLSLETVCFISISILLLWVFYYHKKIYMVINHDLLCLIATVAEWLQCKNTDTGGSRAQAAASYERFLLDDGKDTLHFRT